MSRKKLNIGLFGFGCVGQGLYEVLERTPTLQASIVKICVKNRDKKRSLPEDRFTFDADDILNDPEINVVVELIDDADAAFVLVSKALCSGKVVVSANKKLLAEHFEELLHLQKEFNVPLLYEAACCASLPIIRNLEEYYNHDLLESIEGIVNGSTNYILTRTIEDNLDYATALKQAQDLGFAESNPTLDTAGWDAKYKLCILLLHAFGVLCKPEEIFHFGIEQIGPEEIRFAKEKGLKIKLLARAWKQESGKIAAFVAPHFIGPENRLFGVDDVLNGVMTKSCFADKQFFVGRGAGSYPTASAVLSDISALSYDYRYEYRKFRPELKTEKEEEIVIPVYVRHPDQHTDLIKNYFHHTEEQYRKGDSAWTSGYCSLADVRTILDLELPGVSFLVRGDLPPLPENATGKASFPEVFSGVIA
jgi:homoserine dehydrogenase